MKNLAVLFLGSLLAGVSLLRAPLLAQMEGRTLLNGTPLPFFIYKAHRAPENHYIPSGWMGDYGDLRFDDRFKERARDDKTCIRVVYNARASQGAGWAGIYWQNPANNWGNRDGGYNLNGATRLVFLARGSQGGEHVAEFKVGGIEGTYRDSGAAAIGPLFLTKAWKEYAIALGDQELSSIAGGFCLVMTRDQNPKGATVLLDNIRFE
ncbi:MAG: hypothetical protein A2992_01515 [Elusimicrobia bacterium RIFCSPLOWO2_01_FULL_59_12]|nr:MAG: hypothetical protein A2992_01515 [Elusimicrobia bacterium RIFCSPLOWO2_01_FULL_59_12]